MNFMLFFEAKITYYATENLFSVKNIPYNAKCAL